MAEKQCNLIKNGGGTDIKTFTFDVTSVGIDTAWGSSYVSAIQQFDTGISLSGKKIFSEFICTSGSNAWLVPYSIVGTKFQTYFARGTTGTVTGKLHLMVVD